MSRGKFRADQGALIFEQDISGEKNRTMLVADLDPSRAGHVPRVMKGNLDLISRAAKFFDTSGRKSGQPPSAAINLIVREERIVRNFVFLALPHHHVCGIVQHPLNQHATTLSHDHRGVRMFTHYDWQAPDMIEVTMRD